MKDYTREELADLAEEDLVEIVKTCILLSDPSLTQSQEQKEKVQSCNKVLSTKILKYLESGYTENSSDQMGEISMDGVVGAESDKHRILEEKRDSIVKLSKMVSSDPVGLAESLTKEAKDLDDKCAILSRDIVIDNNID